MGLDYREYLDIMRYFCDNFFSQKIMYYLYLHYGDCEKADSMLNIIEYTLGEPIGVTKMDSMERASKEAFVNINRIGIKYHCDSIMVDTFVKSDTLYKFTEEELLSLYEETYKGIPESAYAKTLYYIGTGEILMFERSERNIEPRSIYANTSDKVLENEVSIFPNPANDKLFVRCNTVNMHGQLNIYDIYGKKVINKDLKSINESIDVSKLNTGVYVLSITDKVGNTIKTEKLVINHK